MTDPLTELQRFLDLQLAGHGHIDLLEAGCGSASHLRFRALVRATGVDTSQKQLRRNEMLQYRIRADLETVALRTGSFNVVICWNVLEHLPHPERALVRLAAAMKPGGLLVLGMPNPSSVKGLITRWLPYRLHVWIYRVLHGNPGAGKDDMGPFPTYMRWAITRPSLRRLARAQGLSVVYDDSYDVADLDYFRRSRLTGLAYRLVRRVAAFLSFGRLGDSELIMVLARQ